MNIHLINIDSTIPNLALAKIGMYYRNLGHDVFEEGDSNRNLFAHSPIHGEAKIFVSCVFDWNRSLCDKWEEYPNAIIGGSGYSLTKRLPNKIESLKPKINYGFTTRGCIRKCPWCIVPEKEGKIREAGDIYDIWDGKAKSIVIMDNNLLALPETFFKISKQLKKEKLAVDFNQGLDHRLLTDEICQELFSLKYKSDIGAKIRFAFDHMSYEKSVLKALDLLKKNGLKPWRTRWYVYVGTYDTVETVLPRLNILRECQQAAFVMRDRDKVVQDNKEFQKLYSWSANIWAFSTSVYEEFSTAYSEAEKLCDHKLPEFGVFIRQELRKIKGKTHAKKNSRDSTHKKLE